MKGWWRHCTQKLFGKQKQAPQTSESVGWLQRNICLLPSCSRLSSSCLTQIPPSWFLVCVDPGPKMTSLSSYTWSTENNKLVFHTFNVFFVWLFTVITSLECWFIHKKNFEEKHNHSWKLQMRECALVLPPSLSFESDIKSCVSTGGSCSNMSRVCHDQN